MQQNRKKAFLLKAPIICALLFFASPSSAGYYSKHHYGHYGHGYGYGHHYKYHRGYHGHYGVHGHFSDTAAYVLLGVLGAVVLSQIFERQNNDRYQTTHYPKQQPKQPVSVKTIKRIPQITYHYDSRTGWDSLASGKTGFAMDVFAIQSQQNLHSGVPGIGFSLATAMNGDIDRAARAMRRAVKKDVYALNEVEVKAPLKKLKQLTQQIITKSKKSNDDHDFMIATLFYLQQDYSNAAEILANNDYSESTVKLRDFIEKQN